MFSLVFVSVGRLAGRGCGSHDGLTGQGLQSVVDVCCLFVCLNGGVIVDDGSTVDAKRSSHIFRPEWSLLSFKFTKNCS